MGSDVVFDVKFRDTTVTLETSEATRLRQLVPALEQEFSLDPSTMKFLLPRGRGSSKLLTDTTVGELGEGPQCRVRLRPGARKPACTALTTHDGHAARAGMPRSETPTPIPLPCKA